MGAVFKALADANRRELLDRLFRRNGQTLLELTEGLEMTRFGFMKHLAVLEEAEPITTKKVGREKHHYLNPVPIRLIDDRWVSKYAATFAAALVKLKQTVEGVKTAESRQIYQVFIDAPPERVWQAITAPPCGHGSWFRGTGVGVHGPDHNWTRLAHGIGATRTSRADGARHRDHESVGPRAAMSSSSASARPLTVGVGPRGRLLPVASRAETST